MHRFQSTCGQVVRLREDSIVFLSRFDCLMVVCITETRENAGVSEFLYFLVEMVFLSFQLGLLWWCVIVYYVTEMFAEGFF